MQIKTDVSQLVKLGADATRDEAAVPKRIDAGMEQMARDFVTVASHNAPVGKSDTAGALAASIDYEHDGPMRYSADIGVDYGYYAVEGNNAGGTRDYIYPVTMKALHWTVGGQDFFAKRVKTYGYRSWWDDSFRAVNTQQRADAIGATLTPAIESK